jgi:hypothetical protein
LGGEEREGQEGGGGGARKRRKKRRGEGRRVVRWVTWEGKREFGGVRDAEIQPATRIAQFRQR